MKKLFTLLMAATLSLGSYAKDYTDELVVDVTGMPQTKSTSVISVNKQENGKYTFLLKNFSFSGIPIGDINLTDVEGNTVNGTTYLRTVQPVSVNIGMQLPLSIILRAEMTESQLKADMDIAGMPGMAIHVTFAGGGDLGGYQIPNSGFEDYYTYTNHNNIQEPLYWHSFASAGGLLAGFVNSTKHTESSTEVRPGSTGKSSLKVTSTEINIGIKKIIANGTVTTGRMNAGAMSADDKANHAQIDMSSIDKDGHGDPYYVALNGQPDSLSVWVAFKQGTSNSKYPYATVSAITTDGSYYQDPEDKTYNNKRAVAKNATIATTFSGSTVTWKRVSIPFSEVNKSITPKTILVTMSTNATPGQGSGSDELYIDDLSLIYNMPTVKSISFKGKTLTFDKDSTATENATGTVSTDDFSVETEGALDGHVFKYMSTTKDSEGKDVPVATIIVTSGDYKKSSTYTINLPGATTTAIHSIATDNNSSAELYNLAGQRINNAQPGQVVIVKKGGKAVKVMK